NCNSSAVNETVLTDTFLYGSPDCVVPLTVTEIVMTCADCKEAWSDWRGEEARDEVVKRYRKAFTKPLIYIDTQKLLDIAEGLEELGKLDSAQTVRETAAVIIGTQADGVEGHMRYHASGTYWSGIPTVNMPCDFCKQAFEAHTPATHACPGGRATK